MRTKIHLVLLSAATLLVTSSSFAATNPPEAGETSTGTATVTIEIPKLAKVTGMADLPFGKYDGADDEALDEDICIYSNMTAGAYTVTLTGDGGAGNDEFRVENGADGIAYTVKYNDVSGTTGSVGVTSGTPLTTQTGWSTDIACGTDNANYEVTFTEAVLLAAPPKIYTGVLTLLVDPE